MKNKITDIEIKNFKTLKHINLNCKRINLFIGKPNVGKSNLLEALSLFGACYASVTNNRFLPEFIRYEKLDELFYDKETKNDISIDSNIGSVRFRYHPTINLYDLIILKDKKKFIGMPITVPLREVEEWFRQITSGEVPKLGSLSSYHAILRSDSRVDNVSAIPLSAHSPVKKYEFKKYNEFEKQFHWFLSPPYGDNLYTIVRQNRDLSKKIASFFKEYKLTFVLKDEVPKFELQRRIGGVARSYPYFNIAETLQRIIFYLTAIESNKGSILLFEEPETHSFPPYVRELAQRIVDNNSNQFFITTHSPFILNTIIENIPFEEVAVFMLDYERFQTVVTPLSEKKISALLNYGNDIFFNIK